MDAGQNRDASRVLVVEDTLEQRRLTQAMLEKAGYRTTIVDSGEAALEAMADEPADVVATDLVMPGMGGLELVEEIRRLYPWVPVVLVTAHGDGRVAAEALRKGAASYIPKEVVHESLVDTLDSVLSVAIEEREQNRVLRRLCALDLTFRLENDQGLVVPLVNFIQRAVGTVEPGADETIVTQLGVALQEALLNAMHHGNLEVSSERRRAGQRDWEDAIEERLREPRYAERRVYFRFRLRDGEVRCSVRDEGPGFDVSSIPDPTDPENLLKVSGRGLYLIAAFMDHVEHNASGNEITMVKRLAPVSVESPAGA